MSTGRRSCTSDGNIILFVHCHKNGGGLPRRPGVRCYRNTTRFPTVVFTPRHSWYSAVHLVRRMLDRLGHLGHEVRRLRGTHVQAKATHLSRKVLDHISNASVRRPGPRLTVDAGAVPGGPQRGGNNLTAQGLGPLRMSAVRPSMTACQCCNCLYQFSVWSIIVIIVVVVAARRDIIPATLLLLVVSAAATVATLMRWWSSRSCCIASLFTASHIRRLGDDLDLDLLLKTHAHQG